MGTEAPGNGLRDFFAGRNKSDGGIVRLNLFQIPHKLDQLVTRRHKIFIVTLFS